MKEDDRRIKGREVKMITPGTAPGASLKYNGRVSAVSNGCAELACALGSGLGRLQREFLRL